MHKTNSENNKRHTTGKCLWLCISILIPVQIYHNTSQIATELIVKMADSEFTIRLADIDDLPAILDIFNEVCTKFPVVCFLFIWLVRYCKHHCRWYARVLPLSNFKNKPLSKGRLCYYEIVCYFLFLIIFQSQKGMVFTLRWTSPSVCCNQQNWRNCRICWYCRYAMKVTN